MSLRHLLPFAASAALTVGLSGCAGSGQTYSALRPSGGPGGSLLPGGAVPSGRANGPVIQPGLQPIPSLPTSPSIQPGPMLPDASGRKMPAYPESAAARRRTPSGRTLPSITPRPEPGAPVAADPSPATLSGQIEIVPGPSIRARRARLEILPPPPPADEAARVEILPPPRESVVEELPAP